MFDAPAEASLPIVRAPWPVVKRQDSMRMLRDGRPTRRPSSSRPDLMAMQSSPVVNEQPVMTTFSQESGLQPSLFGPRESTVMPRTSTSVQKTGCTTHIGAFTMRTSSMRTRREVCGWMKLGRKP